MTKNVERPNVRGLEKELEEEWEKVRPILEKIPPEEITRSIREDRDNK